MANHRLIQADGSVVTDDAWTVLQVANLPDGVALQQLTLDELLNKNKRLDVLIPLVDATSPTPLSLETLSLIGRHSSRIGVWTDTSVTTQQLDMVFDADVRAKTIKANAKRGTLDVPDTIDPDLIVFYVPAFVDGRSFSHAAHLRQGGYGGEIRFAGEFGVDQLAYLKRSGVNSFVLPTDVCIDTALRTLNALPTAYAGNDVGALPMFQG